MVIRYMLATPISYAFHALKKVHKLGAKNFSTKIPGDLVMACHIPSPPEKPKKQEEMPLTSLSPIPSLNSTFFINGMGLRLVNGISSCFLGFS